MMGSLKLFWQQRQPREQRMLICALLVIMVTLTYVLLFAPAWSARQRLQANLPALRQQSLSLQSLLVQAKNLPVLQNETPQNLVPLSKESLEASLKHKNLNAKDIAASGDFAKLQFDNVVFASVLDWLGEIQQNAHWQVVDATFTTQAEAGVVSANLTLRQQSRE